MSKLRSCVSQDRCSIFVGLRDKQLQAQVQDVHNIARNAQEQCEWWRDNKWDCCSCSSSDYNHAATIDWRWRHFTMGERNFWHRHLSSWPPTQFHGNFHRWAFLVGFSSYRILSIQILFLLHLIDKWFSHQCFLRKRKAARHTHFLPASKETSLFLQFWL